MDPRQLFTTTSTARLIKRSDNINRRQHSTTTHGPITATIKHRNRTTGRCRTRQTSSIHLKYQGEAQCRNDCRPSQAQLKAVQSFLRPFDSTAIHTVAGSESDKHSRHSSSLSTSQNVESDKRLNQSGRSSENPGDNTITSMHEKKPFSRVGTGAPVDTPSMVTECAQHLETVTRPSPGRTPLREHKLQGVSIPSSSTLSTPAPFDVIEDKRPHTPFTTAATTWHRGPRHTLQSFKTRADMPRRTFLV